MIYFHTYKTPGFVLDIVEDIRKINNEAVFAKHTGLIILGGGVIKHRILKKIDDNQHSVSPFLFCVSPPPSPLLIVMRSFFQSLPISQNGPLIRTLKIFMDF